MKVRALGGLFLALSVLPVQGQQAGTHPAAFLSFGVGGTETAMGGAATGFRNEPTCAFWNPAGLTALKAFQFEAQYTALSEGRYLNALSLGGKLDRGIYMGLTGFVYSAGTDLEFRQGPTYVPDSVVDDLETAFLLSLAAYLDPRWSLGVNLKVLVGGVGDFSSTGFGTDIGLQVRLTKDTTLGFKLQDPLSFLSYTDGPTEFFPAALKAGISHWEDAWSLRLNADLEWDAGWGLRPRAGFEWRALDALALRAGGWAGGLTGRGSGTPYLRPTFGMGIVLPTGDSGMLEFDYTALPDGLVQGGFLHQISLKGKFM